MKYRLAILVVLTALSQSGIGSSAATAAERKPGAKTPSVARNVQIASQMSLEELTAVEVVYGASRAEQQAREAPSMVSIITAQDIRRQGFRTLADILALARGIFVTDDRNYNYVAMRGFGRPGDFNSHILLTVDGHRLNDALYASFGTKNDFLLDLELIERIEIVRGPASSLYGDNAFFGIINIVTKRGLSNGPMVYGEAGANRSFRRGMMAGGVAGGWDWIGSYSDYDSRGHQDLHYAEYEEPGLSDGFTRGSDRERNSRAFAKIAKGAFRITAAHNDRRKGIPTGSYGILFGDDRSFSSDSNSYLEVKYQGGDPEGTAHTIRTYLDHYRYEAGMIYDYPPPTMNRDIGQADWWGGEWMTVLHPGADHQTSLGLEYRDLFQKKQDNYDEAGVYLREDRRSKIWALFGQEEWRLTGSLLLNAGLRYDHYSTFGGNLAPRAGLILTPLRRTTMKLIYGEAFRAPSDYEVFYNDNGVSQKSHEDLGPEKMRNVEFGVDQFLTRRLSVSLGVYHYTMFDLIQQSLDPADGLAVYDNAGVIKARGFESMARFLTGAFEARAIYCWQIAHDDETGAEITNSPRHTIKAVLSETLIREHLFFGQEVQYLSERRTERGGQVGEFGVVNLKLTADGWGVPGLLVHLMAYNVLDRSYKDPVSAVHRQDAIEQDGRTFWLKAQYSL